MLAMLLMLSVRSRYGEGAGRARGDRYAKIWILVEWNQSIMYAEVILEHLSGAGVRFRVCPMSAVTSFFHHFPEAGYSKI